MDFAGYLNQVREQAAQLRASAVSTGPDADVPTCPQWTMSGLVRHIAKVHNWVVRALDTDPTADRPAPDEPPREWDELLAWWDGQLAAMLDGLTTRGPDAPCWAFTQDPNATAAFWARRQAHETAVHRLDAAHTSAGSAKPNAVPALVFTPEFAADGIDEVLSLLVPRRLRADPPNLTGTVLFHAADAGRAWLVHLRPGQTPEVGPVEQPAVDTDATVAGTADAVYRAAWHRPSTAVIGGDTSLVDALRTP